MAAPYHRKHNRVSPDGLLARHKSADGRFIYSFRYADNPAILRIPVAGGEVKIVAGVGFPFIGTFGPWLGLDPTDAHLMLRDVSTTDVYALTLEEK